MEAEVKLVQSWPAGEDVAQVVGVTGAADGAKAAAAAQLRLPGKGLAQALDAVQRELS